MSAAKVLATPALLNQIMGKLSRGDVRRLARTSTSFDRAAHRFDDAKIRKLREMESQQTPLRKAITEGRKRAVILKQKFEDSVHQLGGALTDLFPDEEWSVLEVYAAACVISAYLEDPAHLGSVLLRVAVLAEGLEAMAEGAVPRDDDWFQRALSEARALDKELGRVIRNLPWPLQEDSSATAKFLRLAPSLANLAEEVTRCWADHEAHEKTLLADETALADLKRAMQAIIGNDMGIDPRLGLVPTSVHKNYELPAAVGPWGTLSTLSRAQRRNAVPGRTRRGARLRERILAAFDE